MFISIFSNTLHFAVWQFTLSFMPSCRLGSISPWLYTCMFPLVLKCCSHILVSLFNLSVTSPHSHFHCVLCRVTILSFFQILLYFLSRVFMGLIRLGIKKGIIKTPNFDVFPLFAALMWGTALTLFEHEQDTLQQSLQNSMQYVFHDSSIWHNVWDFVVYNNLQTLVKECHYQTIAK